MAKYDVHVTFYGASAYFELDVDDNEDEFEVAADYIYENYRELHNKAIRDMEMMRESSFSFECYAR